MFKFFLHYIFAVKVRVCGDPIKADKPAVVIMNHRTRLDWLYFWLALWRINPWLMTTNKIALKELLRYIPAAGNIKIIKHCSIFIFFLKCVKDLVCRQVSLYS